MEVVERHGCSGSDERSTAQASGEGLSAPAELAGLHHPCLRIPPTSALLHTLTQQEVHIMHPFAHDFYGHDMSVLILGYIRPELDYVSKGEL
jgi:hypothetical protein